MNPAEFDRRFENARWFPVDLGVRRRDYMCLRIDESVLERSVFIDSRIQAPIADAERINADRIDVERLPQGPVGWIWHTSFCGSSLLARCLHVPPYQVSLKEPSILRRLGDGRLNGFDIGDGPQVSARLLARPWHNDGAVVIKPTHAALGVSTELMDTLPASRAVLLTSELEDFLVSNIKKSAETRADIGTLANRALRALGASFPIEPEARSPPDFLCAAALQWAAQRELVLNLMTRWGFDRVRSLAAERLYADVAGCVQAVQAWLRLTAPTTAIADRVQAVGDRHAKDFERTFDGAFRKRQEAYFRAQHAAVVDRAIRWAERLLLPCMHADALQLPMALLETEVGADAVGDSCA